MSVPYTIGTPGYVPASQKIPPIALPLVSPRAKVFLDKIERFVEEECVPADEVYEQALGRDVQSRFSSHPQIIEDLKKRAKELGLWNLFLPKNHYQGTGADFTNLEYGLMAEYLGRSHIASEACNCAAPDTGNMEVFAKYGTEEQKRRWLEPLLAGEIRSAFCMTEPHIASSDATNIELAIRREGNDYILNGEKWWSSGAGDLRCTVYLVLGKTDPQNANKYKQQTLVAVPSNTPGVTVKRMMQVLGYDDAPRGHGHIVFNNVRVPVSNVILGEGRGFEVIQGRLGPGRIHHAMRCVGVAERALEWFIARLVDPRKKTFGKRLVDHGVLLERVAQSRIDIDAARLAVLNAAVKVDMGDTKSALKEIAEVKVQVPAVLLDTLHRAMQAYGAAGMSQDTPLARMYGRNRTKKIVDGPDEVHMQQLGKTECRTRGDQMLEKITAQRRKTDELLKQYGMEKIDVLQLDRAYHHAAKL
ncbi:hypothetical protein M409DRAFT_66089 [Zasmidium cellare ATCC 36951]|uniref:Acyl-CoA dehydrogenase NM domain-like protein n=1 Tax=Zasmidium cellare ATCC 36951 TaxID=1080233 RepID=A0A6A6CN87_ZASCE|nr:uncharacterized protein M409DRAFT_66089 [Zasmidium cellare ATCC 36951]KAF2167600.1 hypothetical protein M409DRAFT_66089 [Zasmidium cellare ATCC 36951]